MVFEEFKAFGSNLLENVIKLQNKPTIFKTINLVLRKGPGKIEEIFKGFLGIFNSPNLRFQYFSIFINFYSKISEKQ